jgi:exodeoxyribonuclease VII large subunit
MATILERLRNATIQVSNRLIDPRKRSQDMRLRLDDLSGRLNRQFRLILKHRKEQFSWWHERLLSLIPSHRVQNSKAIINQNFNNMLEIYNKNILLKTSRLRELSARLEALSPVAILERGYSITRTLPDARVVMDPQMVSIDQNLEVIVSRGALICQVKEKSKNGPENL